MRPTKTTRTLGWVILLALAAQWAPGLDAVRWMPDDAWAFMPKLFRPGTTAQPEPVIEGQVDEAALLAETTAPVAEPGPTASDPAEWATVPLIVATPDVESDAPVPQNPDQAKTAGGLPLLPIEDRQNTLARFFRRLEHIDNGGDNVVRVVHYGDSLLTGDYVTRTVRRLLQKRFGDAGHGFVLSGKPASWYRRDHLRMTTSDDWEIFRLTQPAIRDRRYGLGGVTVRTRKVGQWVRYRLAPNDGLGGAVSRVRINYLAGPRGGRFSLKAAGQTLKVDARAEALEERVAELRMIDGDHTVRLRTEGHGEVRLFGAVLERQVPGVVYDALGLDGARARLLRRFDQDHWHRQLRQRKPDLLVLQYGTNESQAAHLGMDRYRADLSAVVGGLRAALPGVSCLLVGPLDRAERGKRGKLVTRPVVKRIVDAQREVAFRQGCAYWNTWRAMGGEGSMARWYHSKPRLARGDLTHPTSRGAERIGAMLYAALMDGYAKHTN
jgi:lysophospholipase L1-like esterase